MDTHFFENGEKKLGPFLKSNPDTCWGGLNEKLLRASLCKILISSFAHKMDFAHNLSVDFF